LGWLFAALGLSISSALAADFFGVASSAMWLHAPASAARFLLGSAGALPLALALLALAVSCYWPGATWQRLGWQSGGATLTLVALGALAAFPSRAELVGDEAFAVGGAAGYVLAHYHGLALPWSLGDYPYVVLFALFFVAGIILAIPQVRQAALLRLTQAYRKIPRRSGSAPWKAPAGLTYKPAATASFSASRNANTSERPIEKPRTATPPRPVSALFPSAPIAMPMAPPAAADSVPQHPAVAPVAETVSLPEAPVDAKIEDIDFSFLGDNDSADIDEPRVLDEDNLRAPSAPATPVATIREVIADRQPITAPRAGSGPILRGRPALNDTAPTLSERLFGASSSNLGAILGRANQERAIDGVEVFAPPNWFDGWAPPPLSLLDEPPTVPVSRPDDEVLAQARLLEKALVDFGVSATVAEVAQGPVVTLFELRLSAGTRVSRVVGLENDLALALSVPRVRVLAPIPDKGGIGIEIPNPNAATVTLRELVATPGFWRDPSPLLFALGVGIDGMPHLYDLAKMPHLLIAGATGAGKSVTLNAIIASILFHMPPSQVRMLMIDPKRVELSIYSEIPHLLAPVLSDPEEAAEALAWAVEMMEERCRRLQEMRVRNIQKYNEIALGQRPSPRGGGAAPEPLPHIVILIDELADLMFATRGAVEGPLVRLAQKARAVGIHLVVATQRPSVDVITGLIKANFPSRVAFQVSSKSDSRIIIDYNGAECLLGRGDMLFSPGGALKPVRLQGAFVSEEEVENLVEFLRARSKPFYMREDFAPPPEQAPAPNTTGGQRDDGSITDDLYFEALRTVLKHGQATQAALTSSLNIGRTNAGRLLDRMEREGFLERRGRFRELAIKPEAALERLEQRSPLSN